MPTTHANPLIEEYVARCSVLLWDLSPDLQDQLREDIRQIVGEVAMELDGRPDDLVGPPVRFVSELRTAAGLPEIPTIDRPEPRQAGPEPTWVLLASVFLELLRKGRAAAWPWTRQLLGELRPAWWVARGLGLAFFLGAVTGWAEQGLLPNLFNSPVLGVFSTLALVVMSVQLGRSGPRTRLKRLVWLLASIAAMISLVGFAGNDDQYGGGEYGFDYVEPITDHPEAAFAFEPTAVATGDVDLVHFLDSTTGNIVASAHPLDAASTAAELTSQPGAAEIVVEYQGHQRRTQRSQLLPFIESLFPG